MTLIFITITILYGLLIGAFILGFDRVKTFDSHDLKTTTKFSIIVPFKNEAENLPELLDSILKLNYPTDLFEVILVDDDSDEDSVELIKKILNERPLDCVRGDIKIITNQRQSPSPKKDAIQTAINHAKNEWITTTDADCIVPENWLKTFDGFIQNQDTNFIAAPVTYNKTNSFLERFQTLDFFSLIGATIGGFGIHKPFMCNGANLAYKKSFFREVDGFKGNDKIASGDDIFLLEKALKHNPKRVHYLKSKEAIVTTKPQPTFKSLLNQRLRWAAKASSYNNWFGKLTGLIVLLMNSALICSLLFVLIGVLSIKILSVIFIFKFSIDFIIISKAAFFLNQKQLLSAYPISSFLYPFFSVFVATLASFKGYKWKGQHYKK